MMKVSSELGFRVSSRPFKIQKKFLKIPSRVISEFKLFIREARERERSAILFVSPTIIV